MSQKQVVARNMGVVVATQVVTWAMSWVVNLSVARNVSAAEAGYLLYAGVFANLLTVFVPLGTSIVLTREVARAPERVGEFLAGALLTRAAIAGVSLLATIVITPLSHSWMVTQIVFIYVAALLIGMMSETFTAALQGLDRMGRGSLNSLFEKTTFAAVTLLCIKLNLSLFWLGAASLASAVVSVSLNFAAFRQLLPTLRVPPQSLIRLLVMGGLPFFAMILCRTVYMSADALVLHQNGEENAVGWYAQAQKVVFMAIMPPTALVAVLLPTLVRLYAEDEGRMIHLLRRMMSIILIIAVPISLVMICLPARIMFDLLPYQPEKYTQSLPLLRIFGVGMLIWYVTQVTGAAFTASHRERYMLRISIVAMVLTIAGCLGLIPLTFRWFGNGAIGGAFTDVAVEGVVLLMMLYYLPRNYFSWDGLGVLFKSALATVPLLALLYFAPNERLWVWGAALQIWVWGAALLGTAIYGVLCVVGKIIGQADLNMVRQSLQKAK